MTKLEILQEIRQSIPEGINCLPGCTACCAHVPWSKTEWELLPDEARQKHTIHSLKCPFIYSGGCSVYHHRAITCRLFGVSEDLPCPFGVIAEEVMDTYTSAEVFRRYKKEFFDKED